ncbi:methylase [Stylonychia lemnae]|uniref:Methylase n=1 Tax=Stylonychia lemnae TaxID=5949 RepID=A0A078APW8_STYLE|nr:methylase [Stylonychia lemnae]|eukprot:CDW82993.1 methylase [Stylonychia lemnae]
MEESNKEEVKQMAEENTNSQQLIDDTYATIVKEYKTSKMLPWRVFVETPSFMKLVGQLTNEDIIDLACGEGFYTRKMQELTTGKVFGFDYCENFIKMAKWQLNGKGHIEYMHVDCSLPIVDIPQQFDLVTPTFLLQNAVNEERFEQMVKNIWNLCKPGGRVCGLNASPFLTRENFNKAADYCVTFSTDSDSYFEKNATEYAVTYTDLNITLVLYWYSPSHYEKTFEKLGFKNFRWIELEPFADADSYEYWKTFSTDNFMIMYEAIKPSDLN